VSLSLAQRNFAQASKKGDTDALVWTAKILNDPSLMANEAEVIE
jgi:hypothetical protein